MKCRLLRVLLLAPVLVWAAACTDPKKPSEATFQKPLQAFLETSFPKCIFFGKFPAHSVELDFLRVNPTLRALAEAGVLSETEAGRKGRYVYELTAEGRKAYRPDMRAGVKGEKLGGLCVGKAVLKGITRFTEPADMLGHRVSEVTYRFTVEELPQWTAHPAVLKMPKFGILKQWHDSSREPLIDSETLVLTNDGWVHERMLKQG